GDGTRRWPRPAGRSGWVRTPTTGWREARRLASARSAKTGVPAKTTRRGAPAGRAAPPAPSGDGTLLLAELCPDARLLEPRQVLDKHLAVQVIDLVLDADREQPVRFQGEGRAVPVQGADGHAIRTLDLVVDARNRQATLLVDLRFLALRDDLGVDEHAQIVALLGDVDHHHPQVDVHLGGGEPDARGGIHGLGHIGHQAPDVVVHLLDRLGNLVQPGVGVTEYVKNGHRSKTTTRPR